MGQTPETGCLPFAYRISCPFDDDSHFFVFRTGRHPVFGLKRRNLRADCPGSAETVWSGSEPGRDRAVEPVAGGAGAQTGAFYRIRRLFFCDLHPRADAAAGLRPPGHAVSERGQQ